MLGFIYGMTHCFLEEEKIISSKDMYQRKNRLEFWINVMHHHMEDTLQEIEQLKKNSPVRFLLANSLQGLF